MPVWGTIVLTLGSAVIAAAAALGSAGLTNRNQRERDRRIEGQFLRDRGAQVIATILLFLDDIEPVRVRFNQSSETASQMLALRQQWEGLRQPLTAYAVSHPSPAVLVKATEVITSVWNSFTSTSWVVNAMTTGMVPRSSGEDSERDAFQQARRDHAAARQAADELLQLIREADGPTQWQASL